MMESTIDEAASVLRKAREVVFFTGAGMSAESGIPTFRDDDGFWQRFPVDDFATWKGIMSTAVRRPRDLADFVFEVVQPIAAAKPNAGHVAIDLFEHHKNVTVITQNIDGLHCLAGNTIVHQIHGSVFEVVSRQNRFRWLLSRADFSRMADAIKRCRRGPFKLPRLLWAMRRWLGIGVRGVHRPSLVMFGDALAEPDWSAAVQASRQCDCFVQVGCSGVVLPAAMLPHEAQAEGAITVAIDPSPTSADYWLRGTAASILPTLIAKATSSTDE